MAERIYPRMSYHTEWPKIDGRIVHTAEQDLLLGAGWDDPYEVRSAVVEPVVTEPVVERKKPGRKPKVQE